MSEVKCQFCSENGQLGEWWHISKPNGPVALCGCRAECHVAMKITDLQLENHEWHICDVCREEYRASLAHALIMAGGRGITTI